MQTNVAQPRPVGFEKVRIQGGFWGRLMETNRKATLPIEYKQCKDTGRIDAWKLAWKPGRPNEPHIFWDSDVAKWIEAAAYSLATHPDKKLERQIDEVVTRMNISLTPKLFGAIFAQWNNDENKILLNFRVTWIPKPGAALYFVLNQFGDTLDPHHNWRQEKTAAMIKFVWYFGTT